MFVSPFLHLLVSTLSGGEQVVPPWTLLRGQLIFSEECALEPDQQAMPRWPIHPQLLLLWRFLDNHFVSIVVTRLWCWVSRCTRLSVKISWRCSRGIHNRKLNIHSLLSGSLFWFGGLLPQYLVLPSDSDEALLKAGIDFALQLVGLLSH